MPKHHQLYLITYDIRKDRSRSKIAHLLEDEGGERIHYSVFEISYQTIHLAKLLAKIETWMDLKTDRVAAYRICRSCYPRAVHIPPQAPVTDDTVLTV